ncbi:MAG: spheroidene monooxygenase [Rubrivivax sp.]|nr:spheroidene monooxygenase [Rubrivivax sp.]
MPPAPTQRVQAGQPQPLPPAGTARSCETNAQRHAGTVAVVVLADLQAAASLWGWSRLVLGGAPLRHAPGLRFAKVLGSGAGGGFSPRPSSTHQGLFLGFEDQATALHFADRSAVLAGYRGRARELLVAVLRPCASRGAWSGAAMTASAAVPAAGAPVAALTRASIRLRHAAAFWRMQPAAEAALAAAPGCLLAAGLGEAPLLRQATFSLWSSSADMDSYAHSGAHQAAIRAAYGGGYFAESMFVRFVPLRLQGRWQGRDHG